MKDYDQNKEVLYLKYWGIKNLYGWVMSQKLPVNSFKWVEETSQFFFFFFFFLFHGFI